jgi:hypothetical protein
MKIIPRENLPDLSLPLPIHTSVIIADAICKMGEEFDLVVGLSQEYIEQLKKLSLDESDIELQANTGDYERFGTGSYEEWYKKNRTIFALIHKQTDAIAALVWFGPKRFGEKSIKLGSNGVNQPEAVWHTVSVRSYPGFRGRGMMRNFLDFSMAFYKRFFIHIKFWAGMDARNPAVIHLLTTAGFEESRENSDLMANWLVMAKM